MSYSGYDIEDAVILNKSSLDRGFGRSQYIRRFGCNLKRYANGTMDNLQQAPEMPKDLPSNAQNYYKKFHALDENGTARVGELLQNGDVFANKCTPVIEDSPSSGVLNQNQLQQVQYKPQA